MSNQAWLINAIYDMRNKNIEPSLITLGRFQFDSLRNEVELLSTIDIPKNANTFMGVEVVIDEVNVSVMRVE